MSCMYECDGCGRKRNAEVHNGLYTKPGSWFQRSDKDGIQDACCQECARAVNQKTGKGAPIIPPSLG